MLKFYCNTAPTTWYTHIVNKPTRENKVIKISWRPTRYKTISFTISQLLERIL